MRLYAKDKMLYKLYIFILVFTFSVVAVVSEFAQGQEEETECNIKPGGEELYCEKELEDVTCRFRYVAQGGTNEKWTLKMSHNLEQTEYRCTVERPSGSSYLFFQEFHLEMEGAKVERASVYGPNMEPLNEKEYKLDKSNNSVSEVQGKFSSRLDKVELEATRPKEEL